MSARLIIFGILLAALGGCYTEERVVGYHPLFAGIPGAVHGTEPTPPEANAWEARAAAAPAVIENEDGTRTLITRTPQQLITNIARTLAEDAADEFVEQLLCSVTKYEYYQRGLDPKLAFATLKEREQDVLELFSRMPMGEKSPSAFMEKIGPRLYRLKVTGLPARGLSWTMMDMRFEDGNWKLRWFG